MTTTGSAGAPARPEVTRRQLVARLRTAAAVVRPKNPHAAAGLDHLADLHAAHATFWPSLAIGGDGVPCRLRPETVGSVGSAAAICADGAPVGYAGNARGARRGQP